YEFVRFRPEKTDTGLAEQARTIDRAVFRGHSLDLALGVSKDVQRSANKRPSLVARNMRKRTAACPADLRWQDRSNIESLHRHQRIFGMKSYGCTMEIHARDEEEAPDRKQRYGITLIARKASCFWSRYA